MRHHISSTFTLTLPCPCAGLPLPLPTIFHKIPCLTSLNHPFRTALHLPLCTRILVGLRSYFYSPLPQCWFFKTLLPPSLLPVAFHKSSFLLGKVCSQLPLGFGESRSLSLRLSLSISLSSQNHTHTDTHIIFHRLFQVHDRTNFYLPKRSFWLLLRFPPKPATSPLGRLDRLFFFVISVFLLFSRFQPLFHQSLHLCFAWLSEFLYILRYTATINGDERTG